MSENVRDKVAAIITDATALPAFMTVDEWEGVVDDATDRIIAIVVKERDAQVARLQEVIRRWALESYTEDTFPGWWMLEEMNGLKPGDLTPAGLAGTEKEQGDDD